MRIEPITESNLHQAAYVHALSWQESHRSICSPEFIAAHTPERQEAMLRQEMLAGKKIYLLTNREPVGVVAVSGRIIEHLYVLPERQRQGYGSALLAFAMEQCQGMPTLWVLNTNQQARRLYERHGFRATGTIMELRAGLWEIEMVYQSLA